MYVLCCWINSSGIRHKLSFKYNLDLLATNIYEVSCFIIALHLPAETIPLLVTIIVFAIMGFTIVILVVILLLVLCAKSRLWYVVTTIMLQCLCMPQCVK